MPPPGQEKEKKGVSLKPEKGWNLVLGEEKIGLLIPACVLSFCLLLLGIGNANIVKGIIQRIIPLGM